MLKPTNDSKNMYKKITKSPSAPLKPLNPKNKNPPIIYNFIFLINLGKCFFIESNIGLFIERIKSNSLTIYRKVSN